MNTPIMSCPNGHGYQPGPYCADCGTALQPAVSATEYPYVLQPQPRLPTRLPKWWSKAVVVVVVATFVGAAAFWIGQRVYDSKRWSGYPHTMGCVVTSDEDDEELRSAGLLTSPPSKARVDRVTLTHLGGDRLQVSLDFQGAIPPAPPLVISPYSGKRINAPGSITYIISVFQEGTDGGVSILSPGDGHGWLGTQMSYIVNEILGEPNPNSYDRDRNFVEAAFVDGKTMNVTLDLKGAPGAFAHGPFRPSVNVAMQLQGLPTPEAPDGDLTAFDPQLCDWTTPTSDRPESNNGVVSAAQPTPPAPPGSASRSNMDDWVAAVCKPGTFQGGAPVLPHAEWGGFCNSRWEWVSPGLGALIHIGRYSSQSGLNEAFSGYRSSQATWAEHETESGEVAVFIAGQAGTGPALEPLKQFGFQFTHGS